MSDFNSLVQYTVESISRPVKYIIYKLTEFIHVVDKFVFRQVPTGAASGYATIEKIEGNTVVFNQLVDTGDTTCTVPNGHKYYANISGTSSIATSDGTAFAVTGGTDNVVDLTATFSSGNEPTTVADFEAWREQNGLPSIADYNAGKLLSVKMESLKSIGFNQWDEEWEQGTINRATGTSNTSSTNVRSKYPIKVFPNTNYYVKPPRGYISIWGCDSNMNPVGASEIAYINYNGGIFNTGNNEYIKFGTSAGYSSGTYTNDICINISDTSKNGTYEPYKTDSADIDVTTITGINPNTNVREAIFPNGMKQADYAGTMKDILNLLSDKATVKCDIVDLGDLDWQKYTYNDNYVFHATIEDLMPYASNVTPKLINYRYPIAAATSLASGTSNTNAGKLMTRATYSVIMINDSSYADKTTFKTAMNGVKLIYELATPIEYTDLQDQYGNPLNPRYKVEQGGTEQVLPTNTSTPTTVAPTLTTIYTKDVH